MRREGRCFICLKRNHVARNCSSNIKCHECGQRHHISVCTQITNTSLSGPTSNTSFAGTSTSQQRTTYVPITKSQVRPQGNVESQQRVSSNQAEAPQRSETSHQVQTVTLVPNDNCASQPVHVRSNTSVLLQTAKALVTRVDCNEPAFEARVLLDTGSQRSYISTRLREALGLPAIRSDTLIVKTFESNYSQVQSCDVVSVCLRSLNDDLNMYIRAFTTPTIWSPIANEAVDVAARSYSHLSDLPLADFCVAESDVDVDMLIGADYFWSIVTGVVRRGEEGPVAMETKLGWVLSGIVSENCYDSVSLVNAATHCMEVLSVSEEEQQNSRLEDQSRKFWELESIGISVKEPTIYERFVDTIKYTGGRYEVELPWKESHALLPDNYVMSVGRLKHLMHCLRKDPVLLKEYDKIIREQERLGIVETVDNSQHTEVGKVHYLPHHPVIRRDKLTTKVRIVFDGSSRAQGPSLNSCLLAGPSHTKDHGCFDSFSLVSSSIGS